MNPAKSFHSATGFTWRCCKFVGGFVHYRVTASIVMGRAVSHFVADRPKRTHAFRKTKRRARRSPKPCCCLAPPQHCATALRERPAECADAHVHATLAGTAPLPSESALLNVLMPTCTPPSPALAGNQMASSSNAPLSELEQLKQLQQSGIISVFDPSFAAQHLNLAWVDAFSAIPPLAEHIPRLKQELPAYLSKCAGTAYDHEDVNKFTKDVLLFWKNHGKGFPTWALAMQIVGSFTPNSAAAERVFSLLKLMFGDMQMSALADMIQSALMLRYNGRKVG